MSYSQVKSARWTASKWPEARRESGVSFTVHKILASIVDDEERFTTILNPTVGKSRWTPDEANRRVGRHGDPELCGHCRVRALATGGSVQRDGVLPKLLRVRRLASHLDIPSWTIKIHCQGAHSKGSASDARGRIRVHTPIE